METQAQLDDLLSRCAWYFNPFLDRIRSIDVPVAAGLQFPHQVPDIFDREVEPRLAALRGFVRLEALEPDDDGVDRLVEADPADTVLLVWRSTPPADQDARLVEQIRRFRSTSRCLEVDPQSTRMEGSYYLWAGARVFTDQQAVLESSRRRLARFAESLPHRDVAYVFGTGPSLSGFVEDHDFSDGVCFAANSMVDNPDLLARLNPRAIIAGDPLFHAGCSRYAGHFRRRLIEAMETTGAWFFTPLRDHHIYAAYLPPHLRERLVAVPFDAQKPYNVALDRDLYVNPKANILTLLLLPLAATYFQEIRVVGCDGRPLADSGYFWAHDKKAQINTEMDNIKTVHPAFFNIDYNDYYTEHCETVGLAVDTIEAAGRRLVTMTPSYVPALAARYRDPDQARSGVAEIISIDPDALDDFGHFLSYDRRLRDTANELGVKFRVYGNVALDAEACDDPPVVERVFTLHSWTVGNRPHGPRPQDVTRFRDELARALDLRKQRGVRSRCVLYMYCGSLPHLRAIDEVLAQHPNVKACVNLFWTSFVDYRHPAYVARWRPQLETILSAGRVLVSAMTPQLSAGMKDAFGVDLPAMPHPSTTFSDATAAALLNVIPPAPRGRPLVLFPGGTRVEKGFIEGAEAAATLRSIASDRLKCLARSQAGPKTPAPLLAAREKLIGAGVPLEEGEMTDVEFAEFLESGDIVVLPYKAPHFTERTSGLVVDAMLLGKPVVVVENTWLADVVREYDTGVIVPDAADAIVEGVLQLVAELPDRVRRTAKARASYIQANTWRAVIDLVASAADLRPREIRLVEALSSPRPALPNRTVFVLGEGALPQGFDVASLHDHPVIVINGGYRHSNTIGVQPMHYVCLDARSGGTHEAAIRRMLDEPDAPQGRRLLLREPLLNQWPDIRDRPQVRNFDSLTQIFTALQPRPLSTLTHAALWAAFLGYRHIVFVGCRAHPETDKPAWMAAEPVFKGLGAAVWDADPAGAMPHAPVWTPAIADRA